MVKQFHQMSYNGFKDSLVTMAKTAKFPTNISSRIFLHSKIILMILNKKS